VLTDIVFTAVPGNSDIQPGTLGARGWFALLHDKPLLGLRNLGVLNIANLLFSIPLFGALLVAHRRTSAPSAALAVALQLIGVAVYIANNRAIAMLALSRRFAAAATDDERVALVAAGEAHLVRGEDFTPGSFPGLFLAGVASTLMGVVVLRGRVLARVTGWAGVLGPGALLIFTAWATFARVGFGLAMALAAIGGLVSVAWYAPLARGLFRLAPPAGTCLAGTLVDGFARAPQDRHDRRSRR